MSARFGPGWGNYAIQGIIEPRMPEPVSMLPGTPGWWLLGTALLGWLLWRGWRIWLRYQRNRYRREARAYLDVLRRRFEAGDRQALRELAPLLRATALQAGGDRRRTAGLSGKDWQKRLLDMAPSVAPLPVDDYQRLAYAPSETLQSQGAAKLFDALGAWIDAHENAHA